MRAQSFDKWEEQYKPRSAKKLGDGTQGDWIVGWEIAKNFAPENVWTVVEDGTPRNRAYLIPGFHVVNKIGYVVCRERHNFPDRPAVYW